MKFVKHLCYEQRCGVRAAIRVGVVRGQEFFLGGVGFLTILGGGVGFFFPNPTADVQLDHFLHHTPELGIPVEMVQFLLKPLLKQISFSSPRFPLISSAKFHSIVLKSRCRESDIFAPNSATLVMSILIEISKTFGIK